MATDNKITELDDGMGTTVRSGVCVDTPRVFVDLREDDRWVAAWLRPDKARRLAEALLKAARKAEG